jgi:hypothetical protein
MPYKIVVSRARTAERHVGATSEEDAIRKVQEELERPYGFFGGWTLIGTDMDTITIESPSATMLPRRSTVRAASYCRSRQLRSISACQPTPCTS